VDANEKGNLFKGIHAQDIVTLLKERGMHVDVSEVVLPHPLKELGTHAVTLTYGGVQGVCTLEIVKK
jgi:ribosomal protein L9